MRWTTLLIACVGVTLFGYAGCDCNAESTNTTAGVDTSNGGSGMGGGFNPTNTGGAGADGPCVNLECQQVDCANPGETTTVSGTIYDPSGTLPLYNVGVYVPNAALDPVPDGLSCDTCDATFSGDPVVSALTDSHGQFVLEDVPVGSDIPLVIQVGKWRREITIPAVAECVDNPLDDPQLTRLPRSMAEGNLPRIALSTGDADPLFCLLRRLGIDDSEFGVAGTDSRLHFFAGVPDGATAYDNNFGNPMGATFPDAPDTLWVSDWEDYDIVLLSCEGGEEEQDKDGKRVNLRDYLNNGGRVFSTHYHYDWFQNDAPSDMQSVATFSANQNAFDGEEVDIDQSFPKGIALAEWMDFVGDMSSSFGQFTVNDGRRHNTSLDAALAQAWVTYTGVPIYFSFNTPIGAPEADQCGRMVQTDIHVSADAGDPEGDFPGACDNDPLTEQEKALIFLFFDLSACVTPDGEQPCPPGVESCGGSGDPVCLGMCVDGCCQDVPQ